MKIALLAIAMAPLLLAGCAGKGGAADGYRPPPAWQTVIRERDRTRLAGLFSAWSKSLGQARDAGEGKAVAALGDLAVTDAAKAGPLPGPGLYRCRTVRIGVHEGAPASAPAFVAPVEQRCSITEKAGALWLEEVDGAQRIAGTLYADGDRLIFLGSLGLPGEMGMLRYGDDADRDQVGVLRPLGDKRWRLELPWPQWQSTLVIVEIVPAG